MKQNLNETGLTWELTFEANPLPIKLYQCKAIPENLHNVKQNPKSLQCSLGEPSIKIFSKSWDFVPTVKELTTVKEMKIVKKVKIVKEVKIV